MQRRKLSGSFQPSSVSRCGPQHPGFNPEDSEGHVPPPSGGGPPTPHSADTWAKVCRAVSPLPGWLNFRQQEGRGRRGGWTRQEGLAPSYILSVTQQRPLTPQWQLLPVATVGSSFWGLLPEAQNQAHQDPSETPPTAAGAPAQRLGSVKSYSAPEMPVANWAAPSLQGPQLVSGRYLGSEGTSTAWRCLFCRRVSPSSVGTL